jgi:hypothetical protein
VRCSHRDSGSWLARRLRAGGAYLVGGDGVEQFAAAIVACQQAPLITDAEMAVGELMDGDRAAHEVGPVPARR